MQNLIMLFLTETRLNKLVLLLILGALSNRGHGFSLHKKLLNYRDIGVLTDTPSCLD